MTEQRGSGEPARTPSTTPSQASDRYLRHESLPGFGLEAVGRIRGSSALVVGTGGLGAPVATYLAAAGVGTLHLVDDDLVSRSNLQRQVLFSEADCGRPKAPVAAARLAALNPDIDVQPHQTRLDDAAIEQLPVVDVVLDCSDNMATRYLLNDWAMRHRLPYVWGSAVQFYGRCSVAIRGRGACLRCIVGSPESPPPMPTAQDSGVFGPLCGVVGAWQAGEALKVLTNSGTPLIGRLACFDVRDSEVTVLEVHRDPRCSACR